MSEFAARHPAAQFSPFYALVLRAGSWLFPLTTLHHDVSGAAVCGALLMGIVYGRSRLMTSRTARSLVATRDRLTISRALGAERVDWSSVLAIESWQRMNRVKYVAVHYRSAGRTQVATCWDQDADEDLQEFLHQCAAAVSSNAPRDAITVAGLLDRGVWLPVVRRFVIDVAVTASAGFAFGLARRALAFGLITASVAALLEVSRCPLTTMQLVSSEGLWWRSTQRGLRRLRLIPRSLRLWVRALGDYEYRARRIEPNSGS
jgi:hypothetical protein